MDFSHRQIKVAILKFTNWGGHRLVRQRGNTAERILIAKSGTQNRIDTLHDQAYGFCGIEVAKTKSGRRLTVVVWNAKIEQVGIALKAM